MPDAILAKRLIVPRGESTAEQRPEKTLVGGEGTPIMNFLRSPDRTPPLCVPLFARVNNTERATLLGTI